MPSSSYSVVKIFLSFFVIIAVTANQIADEFTTEIVGIVKDTVVSKVRDQLNVVGGSVTSFKDKLRPMVITAINNRDNDFRLTGIHFESGKAFAHPPVNSILRSGQSHVFYLSNVDGGFLTGVSGWIEYVPTTFHGMISIGFSHPYSGAVKARAHWGWGRDSYNHMRNTAHPSIGRTDLSGVPAITCEFNLVPGGNYD